MTQSSLIAGWWSCLRREETQVVRVRVRVRADAGSVEWAVELSQWHGVRIVFTQAACGGLTENLFQPISGLIRNIECSSFFDAGPQFCAVASSNELQLLLAVSVY